MPPILPSVHCPDGDVEFAREFLLRLASRLPNPPNQFSKVYVAHALPPTLPTKLLIFHIGLPSECQPMIAFSPSSSVKGLPLQSSEVSADSFKRGRPRNASFRE